MAWVLDALGELGAPGEPDAERICAQPPRPRASTAAAQALRNRTDRFIALPFFVRFIALPFFVVAGDRMMGWHGEAAV
jgi:hypothetical protein